MKRRQDSSCVQESKKQEITFGSEFKRIMKEKNLTQSVVASRAWMVERKINRLANDHKKNPTVEEIVRICLAFLMTLPDASYFMSLAQRTFSPVSRYDRTLKKIIELYSTMDPPKSAEEWLDSANFELQKNGFQPWEWIA